MTKEKADRLTRYLLNADPFLWNILSGKNRKSRLRELKAMGFLAKYVEGTNANYGRINRDLLVELGIEGILNRIVVPKVKGRFATDNLAFYRRFWEQGQTPPYLRADDMIHGAFRIFVEVDEQHAFVERWTVFAGLWFEEIETEK